MKVELIELVKETLDNCLDKNYCFAPTSGNSPIKHDWAGSHIRDMSAAQMTSLRDYIFSEARTLGLSHGRKKCQDSNQTNPFSERFFCGFPRFFWNVVYEQAAREGEAIARKEYFNEEIIDTPLKASDKEAIKYLRAQVEYFNERGKILPESEDCNWVQNPDAPNYFKKIGQWFDLGEMSNYNLSM